MSVDNIHESRIEFPEIALADKPEGIEGGAISLLGITVTVTGEEVVIPPRLSVARAVNM